MKKIIFGIVVLLISNLGLVAQTIDFESINKQLINLGEVSEKNEDYSNYSGLKDLLKDVEIVMLGEQSHGEGTTYETKIKLIKYLHEELGFDILAFESGFYDVDKAWQMIEEGEHVRDAMGKSIFYIWSTTKDLIPLADYLEKTKSSNKPLKLYGFDSQFSAKYSKGQFLDDLGEYIRKVNPSILASNNWKRFSERIELLITFEFKKIKKNNPEQDLAFIQNLIDEINKIKPDSESKFWIQTLKSTQAYLSDASTKTEFRDKQMADNLIWIKEQNPNSKIICWGATSHFLYNSTKVRMKSPIIQLLGGNSYKKYIMMGHYVKEHYGEKVFTIGFTAFQGKYGLDYRKKIKPAKEGTLEFLLSQSEYDNFLVPLKKVNLNNYISRPLGNYYMKNDIGEVMYAVIFNRNMIPPKNDFIFHSKIYPENKKIAKWAEENKLNAQKREKEMQEKKIREEKEAANKKKVRT